jgi:hypothetical protein
VRGRKDARLGAGERLDRPLVSEVWAFITTSSTLSSIGYSSVGTNPTTTHLPDWFVGEVTVDYRVDTR